MRVPRPARMKTPAVPVAAVVARAPAVPLLQSLVVKMMMMMMMMMMMKNQKEAI